MGRLFYINTDFDLMLGDFPLARYQQIASELALNFIVAGGEDDAILLSREVPEQYFEYLERKGITHARPCRGELPAADMTPCPWGWSQEAHERFRACGVEGDHPDLASVKRVNSRVFSSKLAEAIGSPIRSRVCRSTEEVYAAIEACAHLPQVVKPVHSHAGIGFIVKNGPAWSDVEKKKLALLLHSEEAAVLVEPWVDRQNDYSIGFDLGRDGSMGRYTSHAIEVNRRGMFVGLVLDPDETLCTPWQQKMRQVAASVASALHAEAYWGPVGIDLFSFSDREGNLVLQPLCEINARMTMASLAREIYFKAGTHKKVMLASFPGKMYRLPDSYALFDAQITALDLVPGEQIVLATPLQISHETGLVAPWRVYCLLVADTLQRTTTLRDRLAETWRK